MKRIGLTGGIGSGKTTVAKLLKVLGYPVYNSDERARFLTDNSADILHQIRLNFGHSVFDMEGTINRQNLANKVFNDASKLKLLNEIIHPAVGHDFEIWCLNQKSEIVFKEAAIIFEHRLDLLLDEVWVVSAPELLRIQRVMARNSLTEMEIKERMSKQLNPELLNKKATLVIINDNTQLLIPQVIHALEKALAKNENT